MKIAIITPALHYGGGEKQVEFLALGMKARGHLVTVYCLSGEGEIADILRSRGIKVLALYSRLLSKLIVRENRKGFLAQSGIFKKRSAVAVKICRFLSEIYSALKLFAIFLIDRPSAAHLYQNQTKMAVFAAKAAGVRRIVYTETSRIGDWMSASQLSTMRLFWKHCDAIIALSAGLARHMVEIKAADAGKIHTVPTMISLPDAARVPADVSGRQTVNVGIVGRLTPEKGHIFFLKAAGSIIKIRGNIRFIIAGDGYLKDELIDAAGRLGLNKNVEFTGTFKDIADIMGRIDILVLSSLTEGLPLALLEGMAYGKPIVATDVGGVAEIVSDGRTGFVVAPKDPEALADAIVRLADEPYKRKIFADEAIKRFKNAYSSETIIPMIEAIYSKERDR